ncbi:hypothetical protein K440DRAFT_220482 [Wilcoxina mikolae CBS 423.85]|nr:hypothetical protein K440DRAFT_220482 [Wilcoxina mikolae CBS 423.85]
MNSFIKYLNHYGPSLSAASISAVIIIWQTKVGNKDVKAELDSKIDGLNSKIDEVKEDLTSKIQHTQSIALGTAYATMKALSGKKDFMNK